MRFTWNSATNVVRLRSKSEIRISKYETRTTQRAELNSKSQSTLPTAHRRFSFVNYLSHGFRFIDDPYVLAGTAVPDWLSVADRRVRARAARAQPLIDDSDSRVASVARGIVQHHHDDGWFHNTDAFNNVCWEVTVLCRSALPPDEGFRPSFLGHILVEILLDAELAAADPGVLDRYYAALDQLDPLAVQSAVNQIAAVPTDRLVWFIERFCQERFLWDYADDVKLLFRLNQVMRRVRLSPLPDLLQTVLPAARQLVSARSTELLGGDIACNAA